MTGREWLCLADGSIVRVVTIAGELVPWSSPRVRVPVCVCACGAPRPPTAQSCGKPECVAELWTAAAQGEGCGRAGRQSREHHSL
jgi:hypothetical protein